MKTRKLRDIKVSPIGMGCMALSHGYGQIPDEEYSIKAIQKAYETGCTLFDTAEVYGEQLYYLGHNEEIVGKAVEDFREDITLATKIHFKQARCDSVNEIYQLLKEHLHKSLENLRTDHVDLYYLHRINPYLKMGDVAEAFGKLIDEGLIDSWGLSQVSVKQLDSANQITPVSAVQSLYNILERDCEKDIIPYCLENNIGLVAFSPIASGFLSGKITSQTQFEEKDDVRHFVPQLSRENIIANQPILDLINEYAKNKNATPAQISLAWMLKKYPNVVPIPGSKNIERIMENLVSWNINFNDDEFEEFDKRLNTLDIHGHRGHIEDETSSPNDWKR